MNTIKIEGKKIPIIAHRGLSGIERENTAPAFVAAGNRSYFGIETDIHVTADGKFVVIHDETLTRVSDGECNLNVEEAKAEELRGIILPDKDGSRNRADIRIPFLVDYVSICKKYEKICVLEIKNAFCEKDIERLVSEIRELEYLENVIFISFDAQNCAMLRALLPDAKIQYLVGLTFAEKKEEVIRFALEHKLDLDIYHKVLDSEIIENLHNLGIKVNCWTCDDKERAEELIGMGVDFITTNILE